MSPHPPAVTTPLPKGSGVAYLFWALFGLWGLHQFYLNRPGRGVLYLLTLGLFGIGTVLDLFTLPRQVRRANARLAPAAS